MNDNTLTAQQIEAQIPRLTTKELKSVQRKLERELAQAAQRDVKALYDRFRTLADEAGISLDTVLEYAQNLNAKRGPVQTFVHPENPNKVWRGRGRKPGWVDALNVTPQEQG